MSQRPARSMNHRGPSAVVVELWSVEFQLMGTLENGSELRGNVKRGVPETECEVTEHDKSRETTTPVVYNFDRLLTVLGESSHSNKTCRISSTVSKGLSKNRW